MWAKLQGVAQQWVVVLPTLYLCVASRVAEQFAWELDIYYIVLFLVAVSSVAVLSTPFSFVCDV